MPRIRDKEVLDDKVDLKLHIGPGISPDGEMLWDPSSYVSDQMFITLRGEVSA